MESQSKGLTLDRHVTSKSRFDKNERDSLGSDSHNEGDTFCVLTQKISRFFLAQTDFYTILCNIQN